MAVVEEVDEARAGDRAERPSGVVIRRALALRTRLATQLEDEYRVRRLRLAVVLSDEKYEDALTEIRFLTKLLAHRPGAYVGSLNLMHQRIQLRLDERDGKKKKPAN